MKRLAQYLSSVLPGYYTLMTGLHTVQRDLLERGEVIRSGSNGERCAFVVEQIVAYTSSIVGDVHEIAFLLGNLFMHTRLRRILLLRPY